MSCDLLPEWLNLFLDDVETTLCLPILLVMVLCTIQFIVNHAVDIGCTFYQNIKQKSADGEEEDGEEDCEKEQGEGFIDKIKGQLKFFQTRTFPTMYYFSYSDISK